MAMSFPISVSPQILNEFYETVSRVATNNFTIGSIKIEEWHNGHR